MKKPTKGAVKKNKKRGNRYKPDTEKRIREYEKRKIEWQIRQGVLEDK